MIFGVTNVGKTETGRELAKRLGYSFFDMDEVIKHRFNTTLENFMKMYPFQHERFKVKGKILKDIIYENKNNIVIAVCPIFHSQNFNSLLNLKEVFAIELQDSAEHIFERLVFSDEEDRVYKDDVYKEEHREHYIKEIHEDIIYAITNFKKVTNKFYMDNMPVDQVVDGLICMIEKAKASKSINTES